MPSPLRSSQLTFAALALLTQVGCKTTESAPAADSAKTQAVQEVTPAKASDPPSTQEVEKATTPSEVAAVGKAAPDFSLSDLEGKKVSLSSFLGKIVVLEWFNPECPYVKASHTTGSLVDAAKRLEGKGVVYLAINSGAPGKQGHGPEKNKEAAETFSMQHPVLLDETGEVGRSYGATNTPHSFVINQEGILVYAGAVDNSPDGEGKSPEGGSLVGYMEQAALETLDGKSVTVPQSKAYGCSVKYSS